MEDVLKMLSLGRKQLSDLGQRQLVDPSIAAIMRVEADRLLRDPGLSGFI